MRCIAAAALALVALGCASRREGHVYRVPSSSMEPTLHCARPAPGCEADQRDHVEAVPYGDSKPARADIVVFQTPRAALLRCGVTGLFIKRVIGLPGERWSERKGSILIDGKVLPEPWVSTGRRDDSSFSGGRIPENRYLLLGDNRASSCDSRFWGPVPFANIRGKVVEIERGSKRIHLR